MKFSTPMKVLLALLAVIVVLRIITPSPEQVMMNELNQQNQMIQQQTMDMMNGYQQQYAAPNYYQQGSYPQGSFQQNGYQQSGYQQNQYQQGSYQDNAGYNGYANDSGVTYGPQGGDDWNW